MKKLLNKLKQNCKGKSIYLFAVNENTEYSIAPKFYKRNKFIALDNNNSHEKYFKNISLSQSLFGDPYKPFLQYYYYEPKKEADLSNNNK